MHICLSSPHPKFTLARQGFILSNTVEAQHTKIHTCLFLHTGRNGAEATGKAKHKKERRRKGRLYNFSCNKCQRLVRCVWISLYSKHSVHLPPPNTVCIASHSPVINIFQPRLPTKPVLPHIRYVNSASKGVSISLPHGMDFPLQAQRATSWVH